MSDQITIRVDSEIADAYRAASEQDRRKLDLLVNLRLRDATQSKQSLQEVMTQISLQAQQRGLTPEILQSSSDRGVKRCPRTAQVRSVSYTRRT